MTKIIYYKSRKNNFTKFKVGVLIISVIVILYVVVFFPHFFRNTYIVTVTNKQILKHHNTDRYLIYTQMEDGNIKVFENTNNFKELKFNSADIFWAISINTKYEVTAYGFDISILSLYQNIIKIKAIDN